MSLSEQDHESLREVGLFGGLSDDALVSFVGALQIVELAAGEIVFREGEAGREMFLVLTGEIEVLRRAKRGMDARIAMLGPGDWFGEMSILDMIPRSATAMVVGPARLMRISSHDLDALYRRDIKSYALLVLNVAREMSRRLRVVDGMLADFVATVSENAAGGGSRSRAV